MIGDDVLQDVGGAQGVGMQSILVQTGKYRPGDELPTGEERAYWPSDFFERDSWSVPCVRSGARMGQSVPSFLASDFAAAVDWILDENAC